MNKILCVIGVLFVATNLVAQSTSEKLKKEQDKLEKKISNNKSLLTKMKTNTEASLNELRLIDNQIQTREELVRNFDHQIRGAEMKISEKGNEVENLNARLVRLKAQYKDLVIYAYKHRNKFGKMMFIFSSSSYNEAQKRNNYLSKISEVQDKQFKIIRQHQKLIVNEMGLIKAEKESKLVVLDEKKKERDQIAADKQKQEQIYQKFKKEEGTLSANLREDEKKREILKQKISAAIKKEIQNAEAKRVKAEEAARKEAARKAAEKAKNTASTSSSTSNTASKTTATPAKPETTAAKEVVFTETKESSALSKSFEANKGKLPWPVEKGSITEGFGKNPHPTLPNVYTNNNGVDISAPKSAQVRSVFEGEVTSVLNIPGAGKVVIIKHGNYRTVYSNLQDTYVQIGSKVSTKQAIGSLLPSDGSKVSLAHFEIHMVTGTLVQCINPSLWIAN
ncbi:MAG: peptidoglycan DD-metalloendopeptidase family protein [Bacteroidota bacterium]